MVQPKQKKGKKAVVQESEPVVVTKAKKPSSRTPVVHDLGKSNYSKTLRTRLTFVAGEDAMVVDKKVKKASKEGVGKISL